MLYLIDLDITILSLLDCKSLFQVSKVNRYLRGLVDREILWKLKLIRKYSSSSINKYFDRTKYQSYRSYYFALKKYLIISKQLRLTAEESLLRQFIQDGGITRGAEIFCALDQLLVRAIQQDKPELIEYFLQLKDQSNAEFDYRLVVSAVLQKNDLDLIMKVLVKIERDCQKNISDYQGLLDTAHKIASVMSLISETHPKIWNNVCRNDPILIERYNNLIQKRPPPPAVSSEVEPISYDDLVAMFKQEPDYGQLIRITTKCYQTGQYDLAAALVINTIKIIPDRAEESQNILLTNFRNIWKMSKQQIIDLIRKSFNS